MSAAEALKDALKAEDKTHRQESMQTISIMAPKHYDFHPDRPGHAFEVEVTFPHTGVVAPVRFESMMRYLPNVPRHVNPADYYGNIGRTMFLVDFHQAPPENIQAWPEVFVPAGISHGLKITAESMDYNLRSFPNELGAHNTVMDAIAYNVYKTKESANWLFNPTLTIDEALTHLGFRTAPEPEPKEERRDGYAHRAGPVPRPGQYSGVAEILAHAWSNWSRGNPRMVHPMNLQTDQIGYFYSQAQLPLCPQVRALLDMPASTIPHYLED